MRREDRSEPTRWDLPTGGRIAARLGRKPILGKMGLGKAGLGALLLLAIVAGLAFWGPGRWRPEPQTALDTRVQAVLDRQDSAILQAAARDDEARFLTVLIPYDRTRFFIDAGEPRGFEYDLVKQFESFANEHRGGDGPPLQAVFVPTPFSQLVPLLASGTGDIAAGGLTITPTRRAEVDFTVPYITGVEEIAVGHRGGPAPASLEDLAGLEVMLASGTSYVEHVREVSRMLEAEGLAPIGVIEAPPAMMSENVLEMVAAGIVDLTVVDEHIARLWAGVLDELVLFDEVAVNKGGEIAWALRPDLSSDLRDLLDLFMADVRKGTLIGNILFKRYYEDVTWLANPLDESGLEALATLRPYFEAAAAKHDFDWRLLAALAFQESRFDPKTKSRAGALGIMQLMPATAAELGFSDVRAPEANIEAGAAYLAKMRDLYAGEEGLAPEQQLNFALAAYNAGPTRVAALRELAADLGYDPDRWFFNVERAAAREVGLEPVRYVANINSYLLAYELGDTLLAARTEERLSVQ